MIVYPLEYKAEDYFKSQLLSENILQLIWNSVRDIDHSVHLTLELFVAAMYAWHLIKGKYEATIDINTSDDCK